MQRRRLQQALQHAARATVLQALVRRERVLGAVPPVAELAHVQRVRLLVLVLEVPLQRVVAGEGAPAVGALLRLVDPAGGGRGHAQWRGWKTITSALIFHQKSQLYKWQHFRVSSVSGDTDQERVMSDFECIIILKVSYKAQCMRLIIIINSTIIMHCTHRLTTQ